jgi:hypothetical protein
LPPVHSGLLHQSIQPITCAHAVMVLENALRANVLVFSRSVVQY